MHVACHRISVKYSSQKCFEDVRSRKVYSHFIGSIFKLQCCLTVMNIKLWLPLVFYIISCRFSTKCLWDINVFWDEPYHRSSNWAFMQGKNKYSFEQHWLLSHLLSVAFSAAINKVNVYANETFSVLSWDIYLAGGHCTSFTHLIQTAAFCCWNVRCLSNSYFPRPCCWITK